MTNLVALTSQSHRALRVDTVQASHDHAHVNIVGVVPRELQRLVAHYPVFFAKSPDTGQYEPAALLGFGNGENLYFGPDGWDVSYVPLQIQRQPFALIPRPASSGAGGAQSSLDLALDLDSPNVQKTRGERLFDDDGTASKFLQNMSSMLSALVAGSAEAHAFTARLAELNLLEPVQVDIEFVDRSETKLQGLYWIAEKALKLVPAAQLAELRDREYLGWIYFQLASLAHMPGMVARRNRRIAVPTPARGEDAPNVER